jgi:predicted phosphodiesterase
MLVGIISDTHGLLRPEAVAALRDTELVIHAGDVGNRDILDNLREIAPVFCG